VIIIKTSTQKAGQREKHLPQLLHHGRLALEALSQTWLEACESFSERL
jgi:hypothetical protein